MIKLETQNQSPSATTLLEIKSAGVGTSVILSTADAGGFVNEKWVNALLGKKQQILTFIGADGAPCSLEGVVLEEYAVEIAAAFKVVVQVDLSNELTTAAAVGRKSKAYTRLELVRVVEVWDSPTKCLWRAKDDGVKAATSSVDMATGKLSKA